MSTWYKAQAGDIDIDEIDEEVNFYVCNGDDGSIYLTLSFDQIKEIASKIDV